MRAFVTGGTGFVGGRLVRSLRARGDEVVALVRSPERARALDGLGCRLVEGDLGSTAAIDAGVDGCDAVFHCAAEYRIGIARADRPRMFDANVGGTERVLDAAVRAGVARIVYVSTVNVFGDTKGVVVDETYERPAGEFVSAYDESKYLAHQAARARIEAGAPILIGQPGVVYGPGDPSQIGDQVDRMLRGRLRYLSFPTLGCNAVHVEDVAAGLLLVHDRGRLGESYVLGGQLTNLREIVERTARLAGRRPPRLVLPAGVIRAIAPLGRLLAFAGLPPDLREVVSASDGVTYWATDAKARAELGYAPRELEAGLRDLVAAAALDSGP